MISGKKIVLGVSGGIAAYKAAELASMLNKAGATVKVIMTASAQKFITPLTLRSITGQPVVTDMFELASEFNIEHVALAEAADAVVVAPATANIIAKMAAGISDDSLTCTVLATEAPVVVAPAMNVIMYQNAITQANIDKLKERRFTFVDPEYGRLASGRMGMGRLADLQKIFDAIDNVLAGNRDLKGTRLVVTAGGTREAIDPVRYIGNRSSGKMGYAIAEAARDRGAEVILVTAPTALKDPAGLKVVHITSASEMKEAVAEESRGTSALIMAAAVADFQPERASASKIKKEATGDSLTLKLVRTPDTLVDVNGDFIKVGFAAESENLLDNAARKLKNKNLDLIVANDITSSESGFDVDTNKVTLIHRNGTMEDLPLQSKKQVAGVILDRVVGLLAEKTNRVGH